MDKKKDKTLAELMHDIYFFYNTVFRMKSINEVRNAILCTFGDDETQLKRALSANTIVGYYNYRTKTGHEMTPDTYRKFKKIFSKLSLDLEIGSFYNASKLKKSKRRKSSKILLDFVINPATSIYDYCQNDADTIKEFMHAVDIAKRIDGETYRKYIDKVLINARKVIVDYLNQDFITPKEYAIKIGYNPEEVNYYARLIKEYDPELYEYYKQMKDANINAEYASNFNKLELFLIHIKKLVSSGLNIPEAYKLVNFFYYLELFNLSHFEMFEFLKDFKNEFSEEDYNLLLGYVVFTRYDTFISEDSIIKESLSYNINGQVVQGDSRFLLGLITKRNIPLTKYAYKAATCEYKNILKRKLYESSEEHDIEGLGKLEIKRIDDIITKQLHAEFLKYIYNTYFDAEYFSIYDYFGVFLNGELIAMADSTITAADKLNGNINEKHSKEVLKLNHIAVKPEFRKKGVGEKLLNYVIASNASSDITHLVLSSISDDNAREFYTKRGFKLCTSCDETLFQTVFFRKIDKSKSSELTSKLSFTKDEDIIVIDRINDILTEEEYTRLITKYLFTPDEEPRMNAQNDYFGVMLNGKLVALAECSEQKYDPEGFCKLQTNKKIEVVIRLDNILVEKDFRRKRIAEELMNYIAEYYRQTKPELEYLTLVSNDKCSSLQFYKHCNFLSMETLDGPSPYHLCREQK